MLEGLFDEQQDFAEPMVVHNNYQKLPRTCAHLLPIPDKQRVPGTPVGLKNQGCTCYLNSLLQILFFTPQFRNVIYKIPLFKSTLEEPTGYLDQESKTKFVLGFQELFTQMQLLDCRSVGTTNLSDAFGWKQGQQGEQHDINESMIVILETLERALRKTEFEGQIRDSFKIIMNKYIKCLNCNEVRNRDPEQVFQLLTYVVNKRSLDEGITSLLTPEVVEGVECQKEGSKQNAQMGQTIQTLPEVLVITLGRFDFDYESMQRVKLKSMYTFDLEINMGKYLENPGEMNYELYGVLIHSGSAHSGHYIAYVRDIMQESDWNSSVKAQQEEEEKQREKQKERREKENKQKQQKQTTTQPPKTATEQKKPNKTQQKQSPKLKQPINKQLLKNWYQLNDSIVTPISAEKIQTQFEGGECAYILFYRKVRVAPIDITPPPVYLKAKINELNTISREKRQFYLNESEHIRLSINGETHRININDTVQSLLEKFCPVDHSLVNKQQKHQLPYYPLQLNYTSNLTQTLLQADLVHQSKWQTIPLGSQQYKSIQPHIGIEKIPITITILLDNQIHLLVASTDKKLVELRLLIEQKFGISYEKQIIKLLNDYGKEIFLTDNLLNDELSLGKLNFKNLSQINLNYIKEEGEKEGQEQNKEKVEGQLERLGILTFALERDDESGIKRYYLKETNTLEEAFEHFKKSEGIDDGYKRRLRWTNRNRLFSVDQYSKPLSEFPFEQSIVKIKIQRGEIPVKGDICIRVKNQSKYQQSSLQTPPKILQLMQDPNQTLKKLKQQICAHYSLDPAQHKMYRTDWLQQPTRPIIKQTQTLFDANFASQQLVILRDIESKLAAELLHLNLHITKTGFPDDCQKLVAFTTDETKTLKEVKENMMLVPVIAELLGENPSYKRIRLREIKRNYMFGTILRNDNKTLKGNGLEEFNAVVQILPVEEQLAEGDIVLATRHRDSVNRLYLNQTEFIFKASKTPTLKELKHEFMKFMKWDELELPDDELRLFKYYLHDLEWVEWSDKLYKKWVDMKEKNNKAKLEQKAKQKENNKKNNKEEGNNNNNNNNSNKNKKKENKKEQKQQQPKQVSNTQNPKPQQTKVESTEAPKVDQPEVTKTTQESSTQQQIKPQAQAKPKQQKPKKQPKQQKKKPQKQQLELEEQNLRKVPFLLKDGDILGFALNSQMLADDDLQTEEDDNLRVLQNNERKKMKGVASRHIKQNPFQFVLDF